MHFTHVARGILDMCSGQGLAQDLVEGQGCAIAGRGIQQDLVPAKAGKHIQEAKGWGVIIT